MGNIKKQPILLLASFLALGILVVGIVSFATADTTAPVISDVSASTPDLSEPTHAFITWTTDVHATSQVEYGLTTAYGSTTSLDQLQTHRIVSLSGLEPDTTYHFRVKSKDRFNNEAVSADYSFTTPKPMPGDTTAPTISGITVSVTETTATISWTTDELATSTIEFNQCTHTMGCISGLKTDSTADKTSHSVTLSDEYPGTTTNFQVKSKDASGNVAASSWLTFTTSNLPGTGNISGRLIYTNGRSAWGECVYIFKQGEMASYDRVSVYHDGYYIFRNVPIGQYEIYTAASYCPITGFTDDSSTAVTVFEDEETQVETLTQISRLPMQIRIGEPEPFFAYQLGCSDYQKDVVEGPNLKFYWDEIDTAAYYTVEVWSINTDEHPKNKEYDETVTVIATEIEWPTDLSTLIYNEFRVDVSAYTADGSVIASNYSLFCIDQCDGD